MELVPIITQVLLIVAAVFILVLLVSYIASKVKKKSEAGIAKENDYQTQSVYSYANSNGFSNNQYYNENSSLYPKEIKVVRRTSSSRSSSSQRNYSTKYKTPSMRNSRFTVINNISPGEGPRRIETDEYGFKVYADNEITRSVYLPG